MSVPAPFNPSYGSGQVVAATATINKEHIQVCLTNTGASVVYARIGNAGITASAADYPVPPGLQVVVTKSIEHDTVAVSGGSLHVITGTGF